MNLNAKKVIIHDMCLRDGMHPLSHQITVEQMVTAGKAMENAGIPLIEVTHGDGLGGASLNYGFSASSDQEYLEAVCKELTSTRVSALLLPGIGTVNDMKMAVDCGVSTIRIATHCTEADVAEQHITAASKINGLDTVGFLMMSHMTKPELLLDQIKLMESYGANCIYITDSAGYMLPEDVTVRVGLARAEVSPGTEIGFHGHHNMAMGVANSLAAIAAGATRIDASLAGLGAGAGNTPLEVLVAVCTRMGIHTGIDLFKAMDVAEELIVPMMKDPVRVDRDSLTSGFTGVYSSFLLFVKRCSEKYDVSSRDILIELGRRHTVGGQEDMIEDIALELVSSGKAGNRKPSESAVAARPQVD